MITFTEHTWYSRLAAIIIFVGIVPVLAFSIGLDYEATIEAIHAAAPGYASVRLVAHEQAPAAAADTPMAIRETDDGAVLHTRAGGVLALMLDPSIDWKQPKISDASIVAWQRHARGGAASNGKAIPGGSQGFLLAKSQGSVVVSLVGHVHCAPHAACVAKKTSFKTFIVVE